MAIKKIVKTDNRINPFGGIHFVVDAIDRKNIARIIDRHLGQRVAQATFRYSDVFLSWVYSNLCGAECLEDTHKMKKWFKDVESVRYPSPDRLGGIFKSLATGNIHYKSPHSSHDFNINMPLNSMMLDIALRLQVLNKCNSNTLDYDNTILYNDKKDCRYSYVKQKGYQPGICFIGKIPVYIENRNGNSNASYRINETIGRALALLKEKGVKVGRLRSDSAGYQQPVLEMATREGIDFFVRVKDSGEFFECCSDAPAGAWKYITMGRRILEVNSIEYTPFPSRQKKKSYRAVIQRKKVDGYYQYFGILTNNRTMTNRQVLSFYDQRGASERNFDDLKNNFSWKKIPFSHMNENSVFLLATAITNIIYRYVINNFSNKVSFVKKTFRLKNFIFLFITVAVMWDASTGTLTIDSDKDYGALLHPS